MTEIEKFFRDNDRRWFLEGFTVLQVRLEMVKHGFPYMNPANMESSQIDWCKYWGRKLKSMPKSAVLSNQRWWNIKKVINEITDDLDGIPKGQALMLIRTRVGCSEEIMDNIAPNCRVWLDGGIHDMAMSSDYGNEEDCS